MSGIFTSADDLKRAFKLDAHEQYIEFTPFPKGLGFSVQRPYPPKCRYSPPVTEDGTPDTYAFVGVVYEPDRRSSDKPNLVPISAKVSAFSRYISKHWDYDFSDKACPTEESVTASKKTPKPVDLSAFDQYFYDHQRDVFLDADGKEIEGIDIINGLYDSHLATVYKLKGLVFRWKLTSRNKASALCEAIRESLKWLLKAICGRSLEPDEIMRGIYDDYRPEDVKLLKTERIDVFGYKASKNVIVTFSILLLLGYTFLHFSSNTSPWLRGIADNSLLAFAFSVLCITCLDHALPKALLWLINVTNRLRWKFLSASVKFK